MPKHYAKTKWNDLGAIQYWGDDGFKAENISRSKAVYRRRERRVLKRELTELVESEAFMKADELAYLWRVADEAIEEFEDIFDSISWLEEIGEEPDRLLIRAVESARRRADEAYEEWFNAA